MKIINTLTTYKPSRKGIFIDPATHRRDIFIKSLKKQILMIDDKEMKGRRWWRASGKGYASCLRYASNIVEFEDGTTHFSVDSGDELKEVYEKIIDEVENGEYDKILEDHWEKSKFNRDNRVN